MTNDSLIEKINAEMVKDEGPRTRGINCGLLKAIDLIRQHGAAVKTLETASANGESIGCEESSRCPPLGDVVQRVADAIRNAPKERRVESQTMELSTGRIVEEKIVFSTSYELQANAAIAAMGSVCQPRQSDKDEQLQIREISDVKAIQKILNGHKLIHHTIKGGDSHLPLVDLLTPEGDNSISRGMEETAEIAESIVERLSTRKPVTVSLEKCSRALCPANEFTWQTMGDENKREFFDGAKAVLESLKAQGVEIVDGD